MEIGLVGAPSSGKSTFFKAATLIDVKIAPYPFTTIEPNVGISFVTTKCPCGDGKCGPRTGKCVGGTRFVPVKLWDIAGLVPGAHEGRGLGNKFLDNIRQASVLLHILDSSGTTDSEGNQTQGYNPVETVNFLDSELDQWFVGIFKRDWRALKAKTRSEFVETVTKRFSGLGLSIVHIEEALNKTGLDPTKPQYWKEVDIEIFASVLRRSSKPLLVVANKIDMPSSQENLKKLKTTFPYIFVPCAAEAEYALRAAAEKGLINYVPGNADYKALGSLNEQQKKALEFIRVKVLKEYGSTGVQIALNKAIFELLNYIVVYPVEDEQKWSDSKGKMLPDAILLPKGSTPKDLAIKIHSTMAEKFIAAINARTKRQISGDYELQDGDVIKIIFGR